ncbi:hypothetical protein V3589_30070, partial [Sinorhizobium fredii]
LGAYAGRAQDLNFQFSQISALPAAIQQDFPYGVISPPTGAAPIIPCRRLIGWKSSFAGATSLVLRCNCAWWAIPAGHSFRTYIDADHRLLPFTLAVRKLAAITSHTCCAI